MFANVVNNTDIDMMSLPQFVLVHLILLNESPLQVEGKDRKVDSTLELNILFPSFIMAKNPEVIQCAVYKLPMASDDANENLHVLRL